MNVLSYMHKLTIIVRETLRPDKLVSSDYFHICTVHLCHLCNEPTNAQLANCVVYCSLLHCPYTFWRLASSSASS